MTTKAKTGRSSQAGRRGDDVRSDCWVRITPTGSGGIDLDLKTKVESMYGEATRELVRRALAGLGVKHAKVEIEDKGALPFVILAHVETAARRAGVDVGKGFLPELAAHARYNTQRDRFRRSRLYLPGNEPKFMPSAGLHGPDAVILDLEDSVAPAEKDTARVLVRNALRSVDFRGAERMVRINQGELGLDDLDFIVPHNVHLILIPKVESSEQVQQVDDRIRIILQTSGHPTRAAGDTPRAAGFSPRESTDRVERTHTVFLMPIIESALGAIRAFEIASASENIVALTIGLEDYTADIGTARSKKGYESFWARCQVINAARAAGVQPIDTVFSDVADMEGLRESVLEAKSLGFDGKGCIHPRQIAVIHEAFAPSAEELEKAKRIVAAFEEAQEKGLGVVSLGSKMIDPPVVKRAQRIVRLAEAIGGQGS